LVNIFSYFFTGAFGNIPVATVSHSDETPTRAYPINNSFSGRLRVLSEETVSDKTIGVSSSLSSLHPCLLPILVYFAQLAVLATKRTMKHSCIYLPSELIRLVIRYASAKTVATAARVNKTWHSICMSDATWKHLLHAVHVSTRNITNYTQAYKMYLCRRFEEITDKQCEYYYGGMAVRHNDDEMNYSLMTRICVDKPLNMRDLVDAKVYEGTYCYHFKLEFGEYDLGIVGLGYHLDKSNRGLGTRYFGNTHITYGIRAQHNHEAALFENSKNKCCFFKYSFFNFRQALEDNMK
jgi:hypothetical protein